MTSPEPGWADLKRIVGAALERPPEDREAYVAARCADPARRAEVLRLLRACERAVDSPMFDLPAAEFASPMVVEVDALEREVPAPLREALAGQYTIERELGRGGMATVYLARDERHGRAVALKLLRPELAPDDGPIRGAARFQREIEIAASLSHPHVLPLYDSGAAGALLYYITPYVDGETLGERLARDGPPPLDESLRILRDVARALAYAHGRGLVHRDIKPANILLTKEGDALVADFGVARGLAAARGDGAELGAGLDAELSAAHGVDREDGHGVDGTAELTDRTLVLGTPTYMAPEQVSGGAGVDHRADLYAFGVLAYELLTGAPPFTGRPRHELLAAHLSERPEPLADRRPDLPTALASLVDRLLEKRPDARPDDAEEVVGLLDAVAAGLSRTSGESSVAHRPRRRSPTAHILKLVPAVVIPLLLTTAPVPEPLPAAVEPMAAAPGTADREAFDLYERGRHLANTRQRDGLLRAIAYYEQAVARDSAFAPAWAAIAEATTFLALFGHLPAGDAVPRARADAERAISLDPGLAAAHATLAHLAFVLEWKWTEAERELERLVEAYPRYPLLRMYQASFLHSVGRPDEALAQLAIAREINPLTPTGLFAGRIYIDTHRPEAAIEALLPEIELEPRFDLAHQFLAHAYLQVGMPDEAVASMRRAAALSGPRDQAQLAYVLARTGDEPAARRTLEEVLDSPRPLGPLGFHIAMAYARLGEPDEAFRWLEAAVAERGSFMNLLAVAAGFESLRPDPRFSDLLRRMDFPQARS